MLRDSRALFFLICGRLRGFAGFCGRLRAFCGRFAGNSGRGKRETVPILKSHKHIGALVVLGDFTKIISRFTKSKSKPRTTRKFMENESPGRKEPSLHSTLPTLPLPKTTSPQFPQKDRTFVFGSLRCSLPEPNFLP